MAVSRFVAASLLGLLGLSSTALAMPPKGFPGAPAPPPDSVSSAKCEVVSIGAGDVVAARAEAVAKAAAFVCGGEGSADAEAVARASATAFAKATAEVSGKCEVSGDAEGHIWGYAGAVAEGTVWVEAYAEALASAVACGKCDSFAESWAYIGKEVFLKAVAETEADISLYSSDPTQKVQQVHALSTDIEEAIVYAYADALASVSYVYDQHSCYAFGDTTGCIITEDHPFGFCVGCQVGSVSYGAISEINAIAEASASATALACGDTTFSIASALAVASSIAEAHAEATSYIYADCSSSDGGYACAQADSQISETAAAVAEAFASAWAGAVSCGGCYIGKDKLADDIEVILVEASTAAWGSLCVADGDYWGVSDFQSEIESGYAEAIAEACALAVAVQPPGECLAAVTANADVEVTK